MREYPGVYVQPLSDPKSVSGAPTSVVAFIGRTQAGAAGSAITVTDLASYISQLGPVSAGLPLSLAVRDFFDNGGFEAIVFSIGAPATPLTEAAWLAAVNGLGEEPAFNILALTPDVLGEDIPASVTEAAATRCAALGAMAVLGPLAAWQTAFEADNLTSVSADDLGPLSLSSRQSAAVYFPNLIVPDPLTAAPITVSPVGAVAGVWVATDLAKGVWAAPAGIQTGLNGVLDLAAKLNDSQNQTLASGGINAVRSIVNYGQVLWGAHTLSGVTGSIDPYRYIQVRRTVTYIEQSLKESLNWVVFEPDDQKLWAGITAEVDGFLNTLWQAGALFGSSSGSAYKVVCDATNNTAADVANGVVNVILELALLAPAEFLVVELQFTAASAS